MSNMNRTCSHNAMPGLIPGAPLDRSFFAIPNWNVSLVAMTACCAPNEVHITGEGDYEGCILRCLIPDEFLGKHKGDYMYEDAVRHAMSFCIREKGGLKGEAYISAPYVVKEKNNAAASLSRKTIILLGVGY
ncbi:hypothetical protein QBC32DRAFT_225830 [Pseudoneurospora amorphoporcata]|uniref:Uncharacterized protein n=1 Tax=Pseudoneurospora amorphoporcata TaxID=241081 RepID=A0AAN6SAK9_9PEZI|nr:hypothetical protein QBC32DRAFT_225830 [Pseudoneurospora amorphoporcata]